MGAWGTGVFDNDGALDFVDTLCDSGDSAPLRKAMRRYTLMRIPSRHVRTFVSDFCEKEALAACEVVAAWLGNPPPDLPEKIVAWKKRQGATPRRLVRKARWVVRVALSRSALNDLGNWKNPTDHAAWRSRLDDLLARLS